MVIVVTNDRLFGQRIRFELTFAGVSPRIVTGHDTFDFPEAGAEDALVLDVCSGISPERYARDFSRFEQVILLSDKEENVKGCKTLVLPLPLFKLAEALQNDAAPLRLSDDENERFAVSDGKKIPLSATEYSLLKALYEADGAFVSRQALLQATFGDRTSQSALNVYIHYLREKLENGEKRLIFSSRKQGYALILPKRRTPC